MRLNGSTWVKLYRSILDWEWFKDGNMLKLMIYLILNANVQDGKHEGEIVRRGQMVTTRKEICSATGLSEQNAKTCLKRLLLSGEILLKSTNKFSLITVCKYDTYQNENNLFNQQLTNEQPTTNQPTYYKNNKEYKNNTYRQNKELILQEGVDFDLIRERYNREFAGILPQCFRISKGRREKIMACVGQNGRGSLDIMFKNLHGMKYYLGENRTGFVADFSFIFEPENYLKIVEGPVKKRTANSGTEISIKSTEEMRDEEEKAKEAEKKRVEEMVKYAEENPNSVQAEIVSQWRSKGFI